MFDENIICDNDVQLEFPQPHQVVYLDFDGAETFYRNEELEISTDVVMAPSHLNEDEKQYILVELSKKYALDNILFTLDKPDTTTSYSTVFIGETDAFEKYGVFSGLAETIDKGNLITDDNAFVFTNHTDSVNSIFSVIVHEIDHIIKGCEHPVITSDITDYAAYTVTQSGNLRGSIEESYRYGSYLSDSYLFFTIEVPTGKQAAFTIDCAWNYDSVNCSSSSVYADLNGRTMDGLSFTVTETTTVAIRINGKIANPYIDVYYTKCDITVSIDYSTRLPQADLLLYRPANWSSAMLISSNTASVSDQQVYTTDDELILRVCYGNAGTLASASFDCIVEIDGKTFLTEKMSGLAVNKTAITSLNLGKLSAGQHTVKFKLDTGNSVNEANESNNVITKTFTVLDATLPDLKITNILLPETKSNSSMFDIAFTVANTGRTTAAASVVHIFDGSTKIGEIQIEALASGSSIQKSITIQPWALPIGEHTFTFITDPENSIAEVDNSNNSETGKITIIQSSNVPENPNQINYTLSGSDLVISWTPPAGQKNVGYQLLFASENNYEAVKPITVYSNSYTLTNPEQYNSWKIRVFDSEQQYSAWSEANIYYCWTRDNQKEPVFSYNAGDDFESAAISFDHFAHSLTVTSRQSDAIDYYNLPKGIACIRKNPSYYEKYTNGEWHYSLKYDEEITVVSPDNTDKIEKITALANQNIDVFFANPKGIWQTGYAAKHTGKYNGWQGTGTEVSLAGKNKLSDIFEGSSDANILVMTDDQNGDALFVDDIYTPLGDQARLSRIDEIRAGYGDDIVDMTSQKYAYNGNGVTIYGGDGNDTIWANSGNNTLYGDAGNDNLAGGSGNDLIVGGSGNDCMHGGGGSDLFTFCENWGNDIVEQLAGDSVKLWLDTGSLKYWDAASMTYNDGQNSIQVKGISIENITIVFSWEEEGIRNYDLYRMKAAFDAYASDKIFEDTEMNTNLLTIG